MTRLYTSGSCENQGSCAAGSGRSRCGGVVRRPSPRPTDRLPQGGADPPRWTHSRKSAKVTDSLCACLGSGPSMAWGRACGVGVCCCCYRIRRSADRRRPGRRPPGPTFLGADGPGGYGPTDRVRRSPRNCRSWPVRPAPPGRVGPTRRAPGPERTCVLCGCIHRRASP